MQEQRTKDNKRRFEKEQDRKLASPNIKTSCSAAAIKRDSTDAGVEKKRPTD